MLVVLFGLAGAGKSYVGNLLGERSNFYFWDADEALTDDINACIREKRSISQDMRDSYFNIVMNKIELLCLKHENVVIAQAFYKNKNREQVLLRFPGSLFLQVTSNFEILLNRLRKRNNDVDGDYALKISSGFENPTHKYYVLTNASEGDSSFLMRQFMDVPLLRVALLNETGFGLKNRSGLDRFSLHLPKKLYLGLH